MKTSDLFSEAPRTSADDVPTITSLGYILNYFEFIAVGLAQGDMDEPLLKKCLAGILNSLNTVATDFLKYEQQKDKENLQSFIAMQGRWNG